MRFLYINNVNIFTMYFIVVINNNLLTNGNILQIELQKALWKLLHSATILLFISNNLTYSYQVQPQFDYQPR